MKLVEFSGVARLVRDKAYDPQWVAAFAEKLGLEPARIKHVEVNAHDDDLRMTGRKTAEINFDVAAISGGEAHCASGIALVEMIDDEPQLTLSRFIEPENDSTPLRIAPVLRKGDELATAILKTRELAASLDISITGFARLLIGTDRLRQRPKAKFRHPDNPAITWSGRGARPRWFKEYLGSGRPPIDLMIQSGE